MSIDWDAIATILGETIGEASLCWEPKPVGVFDSTHALKVFTVKMARLKLAAGESPDIAWSAGQARTKSGCGHAPVHWRLICCNCDGREHDVDGCVCCYCGFVVDRVDDKYVTSMGQSVVTEGI